MIELGELEQHHEEFAKRQIKIVVVSNDNQEEAQKNQADFPHLIVVADTDQKMAKAVEVIHAGASRDHTDTNAPTTLLVDGTGTVRWFFRPDYVIARLSTAELLDAIDKTWPAK